MFQIGVMQIYHVHLRCVYYENDVSKKVRSVDDSCSKMYAYSTIMSKVVHGYSIKFNPDVIISYKQEKIDYQRKLYPENERQKRKNARSKLIIGERDKCISDLRR